MISIFHTNAADHTIHKDQRFWCISVFLSNTWCKAIIQIVFLILNSFHILSIHNDIDNNNMYIFRADITLSICLWNEFLCKSNNSNCFKVFTNMPSSFVHILLKENKWFAVIHFTFAQYVSCSIHVNIIYTKLTKNIFKIFNILNRNEIEHCYNVLYLRFCSREDDLFQFLSTKWFYGCWSMYWD